MNHLHRICIVPTYAGVGGPASFRMRFTAEAERQGLEICNDLDDHPYDAVMVIGGTRQLAKLWQVRWAGIPIVQRLDGFNWIHRRVKSSPVYWVRAEIRNWILRVIRSRLATSIVYQSKFVVENWNKTFGEIETPYDVIYNGVDLKDFSPDGPGEPPSDRLRINLVEGAYHGGHDISLKMAMDLSARLISEFKQEVELNIAGEITPEIQEKWNSYASVPVNWLGVIDRSAVPELHRSAHLYFSSEINAPCPNSVIEALACGLPVAAFDTGSLPQIVTGDAGRVVPFGANPWKLEPPDIPALAEAVMEIYKDQPRFRKAARQRAVEAFDIQHVVARYLEALRNA